MRYTIESIKGMHPGALIKHELNKKKISQRKFAASIGEHCPQEREGVRLPGGVPYDASGIL